MLIVLDANVLFQERHLENPMWPDIQFAQRQKGVRVVVPRVVLDECVAKQAEALRDHIASLAKLEGGHNPTRLRRHVAREIAALEEEIAHTRERITASFSADRIEIADLPADLGHMEVVERALQRRRPFDAEGRKGYRDALIWHTVLDLARLNPDENVVLVARDYSAFADDRKEKIHPDLLDDLRREKLDDRVHWVPNLQGLREHGIEPAPEPSPEMERIGLLFDWLPKQFGAAYPADVQPLGFPEGFTVLATPEVILTLIASFTDGPGGSQVVSFTFRALANVDASRLLGAARYWPQFGEPDAWHPFVFEGTVEFDVGEKSFHDLKITHVEPDQQLPISDYRDAFEPNAGAAVNVIRPRIDSVISAMDPNEWTAVRVGDCWNDMTAVAIGVPRGQEPHEVAVSANGQPCDFRNGPVLAALVPANASTIEVHTESETITIPIAAL